LVREVIAIDVDTKIEPVLSYLKNNDTQIGIVTKLVQRLGKTPEVKKIGIITFEDIVEELLQEEIEDEREVDNLRGERKKFKNKLIYLFGGY